MQATFILFSYFMFGEAKSLKVILVIRKAMGYRMPAGFPLVAARDRTAHLLGSAPFLLSESFRSRSLTQGVSSE